MTRFATFDAEIQEGRTLKLPTNVCDKLRLDAGDRVEISIKKIKSGRLDLILAENPLVQILNLRRPTEPETNNQ